MAPSKSSPPKKPRMNATPGVNTSKKQQLSVNKKNKRLRVAITKDGEDAWLSFHLAKTGTDGESKVVSKWFAEKTGKKTLAADKVDVSTFRNGGGKEHWHFRAQGVYKKHLPDVMDHKRKLSSENEAENPPAKKDRSNDRGDPEPDAAQDLDPHSLLQRFHDVKSGGFSAAQWTVIAEAMKKDRNVDELPPISMLKTMRQNAASMRHRGPGAVFELVEWSDWYDMHRRVDDRQQEYASMTARELLKMLEPMMTMILECTAGYRYEEMNR